MPKKTLLFKFDAVRNRQFLADALASYVLSGKLSRNQLHTITIAAAPALPGEVEIHQRSPKGATYVRVNDTHFTVNVRAKLVRENPDEKSA